MVLIIAVSVLSSCGVSKSSFSPAKKYAPEKLQKDYAIYQETLEEAHPGLYWYTSKDSMKQYFDWGRKQLTDSLTEAEFRKVLSYVTSKINCGHTSIRSSKNFSRYLDTLRLSRIFPLSLKLWDDTAVVAANLNRRDSILKRGVMITKINGHSIKQITDTLFNFISTDGYNTTHKYQSLSNRGFFGSLYSSIYGYTPTYKIEYEDSAGAIKQTSITLYRPVADTSRTAVVAPPPVPQPSRKERKRMRQNAIRLLRIDSAGHVAMMDLNSFARGYGLKGFFRRSFRVLRKTKVEYLMIDVRGNGGGSVSNSNRDTTARDARSARYHHRSRAPR